MNCSILHSVMQVFPSICNLAVYGEKETNLTTNQDQLDLVKASLAANEVSRKYSNKSIFKFPFISHQSRQRTF